MPALSFAEDVDARPDTALLPLVLDWVVTLSASKSPLTVRSYVADAALIGSLLAQEVDRPGPTLELPATIRVPAGVSVPSFTAMYSTFAVLQLGDLHPAHLERVFLTFAAQVPGRRRRPRDVEPRRNSTRRRAAASFTTFCEYATVRGYLAANPMRDPRIVRGGRATATPTSLELFEVEKLLQTVCVSDVVRTSRKPWPVRDVALAAVLLTTGLRLAETISVRVGDLRDVESAPHVTVLGKGSKFRTIPLARDTVTLVQDYLTDRHQRFGAPSAGDPLFVRVDGRPFTARSLEHLVYRWYERAGVQPRGESCVHVFRHTFATQLVNAGASIVEVQELLGHESLETTKRYLRSVGFGLRDAVEANPSTALVRSLTHRPVSDQELGPTS